MFDAITGLFGSISSWFHTFTEGFGMVKNAFANGFTFCSNLFPFIPDSIVIVFVVGISLLLVVAIIKLICNLL